jgi:hypothetical protein
MKKYIICLIIILFTVQLNAESGEKDNPIAIVKKVVKNVQHKNADTDWVKSTVGTPLYDHGEIKTDSKSLALVLFTDGSGTLTVRENSILHIYGAKSGKLLNKDTNIEKGTIGFSKDKNNEGEFKFTTPSAVASIRGTTGVLDVNENVTIFIIQHGSGTIVTRDNQCLKEVKDGFTAIIDNSGQCTLRESTEEEKNLVKNSQLTSMKELRIKTNYGDLKIEYFDNQ